ncbi:MAG: hypothetical protein HKM07_05340 [Chlamydiae bacterium]|nr:hypothetical protein [Chlamydiota bacterium]
MSTEKQMIQPKKEKTTLYYHYEDFNYSDLFYPHSDNTGFIRNNALHLEDYAGDYYTGNELMFYPTLAQKIRALKHYPLLTCDFKIDKGLKGKAFIIYFHHRTITKIRRFKKWVESSRNHINTLVEQFGGLKQAPIIESYRQGDGYDEYINLKHLLQQYAQEARYLSIDEIIPKTPYLAVRFKNEHKHVGKVKWFDLNTGEMMQTRLKIIKIGLETISCRSQES